LSEAPAIVGSPFLSSHQMPGTRGDGAIVQGVLRIHQDSYDQLFRGASSSQNFYDVQQQQLNALQASLGDPSSGINTQYTKFQTAISQLAAQPGDIPARANVISQAQALSASLNNAASTITMQKAQLLQQGSALVTKVNGILDSIAALNSQIRASTAVGDSPNTFKDQRDQLIDQLSQYLSTQTSIQATGSTLVTVNGQAMVNDAVAYHLAPPVVGSDPSGNAVLKIGFANDPNIQAGNDPGVPLGSGQLQGLADLYNNKLTVYGQQLDGFAASLASEVNRVTMSGYDQNGVGGAALFQPITSGLAISAGNIKCGITDPAQIPAALANTSAGSLVLPLNSANNSVDSSAAIGNPTYATPLAGPVNGTLTVTTDGVAQTFTYNTATTDTTLDAFVNHFNSQKFGVTASFDATSQKIVFRRDPANTDLTHRAAQQAAGAPVDPTFTIADTPAGGPPALLNVLGAAGINGVVQNSANALGKNDNGAANALLNLFSMNVGVPAIQTTSNTAVAAPGSVTIAPPVANPTAFAAMTVGQVLTVDAGTANQENVIVTAINRVTGTFTATFANAHGVGFSIASAQLQTLGQAYGRTITQIGLDSQTANNGVSTQTTLTKRIDAVRQGIDGINLDEETQNLVKYQQAYQAAARTINVLDQMLSTIVNSLGPH
ncbi:MAG TPA: flagellar basal body rod C-terminal domain-containing protein, partial [Candidatus Baltobacteraceae bacterium]|nr:flagellar basal body rod C-terminal domain-containing protein [Candidatus Baltobacteraceae bacterium]